MVDRPSSGASGQQSSPTAHRPLDAAHWLGDDVLVDYAIDGEAPDGVVRPESRQQVAEVVRWARQENISLFPRGGGVHSSLGNPPGKRGVVLDLSRCNRVLDFQPSDLTVTVEAGVTLDGLQQHLAVGRKFLPLESPLSGAATIGGILAANVTGPLRSSLGLPREWLIGIGVVNSHGVETKAGGKVVKNVTGYDLDKLYTGSLGTLGIIVEAAFKLAPLPAESGALMAVLPSMQAAVDSGSVLVKQVYAPQGVQVLNQRLARRLFQRIGANPSLSGVQLLETGQGECVALALFNGRAAAVRRKLRESAAFLKERGASQLTEVTGGQAARLHRAVTDLGWERDDLPHLALRINVAPSDTGKALGWLAGSNETGHVLQAEVESLNAPVDIIADPGFGMVRVFVWPDGPESETGDAQSMDSRLRGNDDRRGEPQSRVNDTQLASFVLRVRELASGIGGSVVVERATPEFKGRVDVWGDSPEGSHIMTSIKQKFDPMGILNPGRFVGGI